MHPFDPKTVFLAKHAQHVVLIHFPIALFITAIAFDFLATFSHHRGFADVAYFNLLSAAAFTVPTLITGILAWQFQLEGQKLKGVLLLHLIFATLSSLLIFFIAWLHFRACHKSLALPSYRLPLEILAVLMITLTGHLGGFLSGVNLPN